MSSDAAIRPQTPDDVTALAHRHMASNALLLLIGAANHLREAGYGELADKVAALLPAVEPLTKSAGIGSAT